MRAYHWFTTFLIVLVGAALLLYWPQTTACMAATPLPKASTMASPESVMLESRFVRGATISLITVDLNDATVKVDIGLPERGIPHAETFQKFMNRHNPLAAVTGTYFDIRTSVPTGSIVVGGKLMHESNIGTAVCFSSTNRVRFIPAKYGQTCDLSGAECAVRTGPRLLANGYYALNPRQEGFRHPGLYGARTRMVLGITAHNKLLLAFVRTPVTFSRASSIMKALGATDAVCLDGGTSSAMYFKGQTVRHPGRMLTNVIEVRRRPLSEMPAQLIASAGGVLPVNVYHISRYKISDRSALLQDRESREVQAYQPSEQAAILGEPLQLRRSKGIHSLFPIDRTKLTGLKGYKNS